MITLDLYELKTLCADMAELGAANYAKKFCPVADCLSQREAYNKFGESWVKARERMNIIHSFREGTSKNSKRLYSYAELLSAKEAEKLGKLLINK
ncbi:MAG: hypothetical protein LBS54_04330 [Dysgonamonadaceae bacterium]|jgi:hypothetical protein|nr:hypothetical protein [Dysgonamonadaceae bacterium]